MGWVSNSQLTEKKYVIITSNSEYIYKFPNVRSKKIAKVMKNFVLENAVPLIIANIIKNNKNFFIIKKVFGCLGSLNFYKY